MAMLLSMAVAIYAVLTPAGSRFIYIQGRYLGPMWLLLLLSVYGIAFTRRQLGRFFTIGALLVIMGQNLATLAIAYRP